MFSQAFDYLWDGCRVEFINRQATDAETDAEQRVGQRQCGNCVGRLHAGLEPGPDARPVGVLTMDLDQGQSRGVEQAEKHCNE